MNRHEALAKWRDRAIEKQMNPNAEVEAAEQSLKEATTLAELKAVGKLIGTDEILGEDDKVHLRNVFLTRKRELETG